MHLIVIVSEARSFNSSKKGLRIGGKAQMAGDFGGA
jgi:hypothetical protein